MDLISRIKYHNAWRRGEHDNMTDPTQLGKDLDLIVSEHDKMATKIVELEAKIEEHNSVFKDIYSACIGELTMGYKLDADALGRHVYSVCDFNAEGKPKGE